MDSKLTLEDILRLETIFEAKHWRAKFGNEEVFKIISDMLASFSEQEKELLFDLCDRYLWISMPEYTEHLLLTLDQISNERLNNITRIMLFPIVKLKDINKVKSSAALLYNFRMAHFGGPKFRNIEFRFLETLKALENEAFGKNDLLFLIDDFVGTGKTFEEILEFSLHNKSLSLSQITAVSLVAQEETANHMAREGIDFYYFCTVKKGISDYYSENELAAKIDVMQNLEKLIPSINDYTFGFDRSEALVTMNRTPNNTFPIFWKSHRRAGKYIKAPFPRHYER